MSVSGCTSPKIFQQMEVGNLWGMGRGHKVKWKIVLLNYCAYTEAALPMLGFSQNIAISVT